jgi:serine phosphatase RsbU (regulator of sigma subunit)
MLLADVSGHGVKVAAAAERLRRIMSRHANYIDQTRFVGALNEEFGAIAQDGGFATALVATYWAPSGRLTICNAGHPRPLWWRARERAWTILEGEAARSGDGLVNLPIGVAAPTTYSQFGVRVRPGDLVLVYTDALIEARRSDGAQLGESGLLELVSTLDPDEPADLLAALRPALDRTRAHAPAGDDETALLVRATGGANLRPDAIVRGAWSALRSEVGEWLGRGR